MIMHTYIKDERIRVETHGVLNHDNLRLDNSQSDGHFSCGRLGRGSCGGRWNWNT